MIVLKENRKEACFQSRVDTRYIDTFKYTTYVPYQSFQKYSPNLIIQPKFVKCLICPKFSFQSDFHIMVQVSHISLIFLYQSDLLILVPIFQILFKSQKVQYCAVFQKCVVYKIFTYGSCAKMDILLACMIKFVFKHSHQIDFPKILFTIV